MYFDDLIHESTKPSEIITSITTRLAGEDQHQRWMACTDLSKALRAGLMTIETPQAVELVRECGTFLLSSHDRGLAWHALAVLCANKATAEIGLPYALSFLKDGFPGRKESGTRVEAMRVIEVAETRNLEVKETLQQLAKQEPQQAPDEVRIAQKLLDKLFSR